MCGIAGIVGGTDVRSATLAVDAMKTALRRRGPDSAGVECWNGAILGHRRLSIFDLSAAGHQPMLSADRSVGVTFNGAIYNFPQLRSELEGRGYAFKSATDTEVLIHGYMEWGIDALVERLRGMFAFGLWDDRSEKLFLVRDRLGVKPLLYVATGGSLAFASTARALREGGSVAEIDDAAISEFLEFGYVTDGRAIYRGAAKVPAASILEWSRGSVAIRQYWAPPAIKSDQAPRFGEAVEETRRLLLAAVERRLQADVPVGALLSAGVDSSLICWAITRLGGDVTAFTVATPNDPWDESDEARRTAKALNIRHQVLDFAPDPDACLDDLVSAYGEPFACASALGMLAISQAVAGSAKVLLTGDGGDDVFLGYPEHRHLWMGEYVARCLPPGGWWQTLRRPVPRVGPLRRAVTFMDFASGGLGGLVNAHDGLPYYIDRGLFGPRLRGASVVQRAIPWSHASARRILSDFLEYDWRTRFVGEYMTKVDGATMFHGLEARSPFLDQDLWEFAASLPFSVRLRRGELKAVLRALALQTVGPRVAHGRKRGFGIPVQRWIAGRWRARVDAVFNESLLVREGWIDGAAVRRELADASRAGWAPKQLWYLFVLERWLRHERQMTAPATAAVAS